MAKRKNRTTANGMILRGHWSDKLFYFLYRYRYKVKVPNIEKPLTLIVYYYFREFKEGDTVSVEYDPDNPKRCKLAESYSY